MSGPRACASAPQVRVTYSNAATSGTLNCAVANSASGVFSAYRCPVPVVIVVAGVPPVWSGVVDFQDNGGTVMAATLASNNSGELKACRYPQTPATYNTINAPRADQNYLFIRGGNGHRPPRRRYCRHQQRSPAPRR